MTELSIGPCRGLGQSAQIVGGARVTRSSQGRGDALEQQAVEAEFGGARGAISVKAGCCPPFATRRMDLSEQAIGDGLAEGVVKAPARAPLYTCLKTQATVRVATNLDRADRSRSRRDCPACAPC
jgi:hypothetical protein